MVLGALVLWCKDAMVICITGSCPLAPTTCIVSQPGPPPYIRGADQALAALRTQLLFNNWVANTSQSEL